MKREIKSDYDKEHDILSFNWGKCEHSMEVLNDKLIIDFNKKGDVVGFEFFDFGREIEKTAKKHEKIFKRAEKRKLSTNSGRTKA